MDSVDMSVNCEQKVAANVSEAFTTVETGLDNFGKHSEQGEVAVDYTEPIDSYYRCDSYPSI
jgi:virulence-associated protein VapD